MSDPLTPAVSSADGITPAWLTSVLRQSGTLGDGVVSQVAVGRLGHGQAADCYRLTLTFDGDRGAAPETLIGKFTSGDARSARTGGQGLYEGEVRFYLELASQISARTPRAYGAEINESGSRFFLILEDLAPAAQTDQLTGLSVDQVALALGQAASFHAATWRRVDLAARPWLSTIRRGRLLTADALPRLAVRMTREFDDLFADDDLRTALELTRLIDPLKRVLDDPVALWHQDFRADNLLFDARGGQVPVAVLDWQTVTLGPAVADASLLIGGSLPTSTRRAHERDLVRVYHQALVAGGVSSYTFDDCWTDYRISASIAILSGIAGPVQVKRTPRGDLLWQSWLERHCAQVQDLESYDLLAKR